MTFTICYTSSAVNKLSITELESIFEKTMGYNNKKNITGILLYAFEVFFQVLEGDEEEITTLFRKVINDNRHKNIFLVMKKESPIAYFKKYSSKFNVLKTSEEVIQLKKYIQEHSINKDTDKFERLLSPFALLLD